MLIVTYRMRNIRPSLKTAAVARVRSHLDKQHVKDVAIRQSGGMLDAFILWTPPEGDNVLEMEAAVDAVTDRAKRRALTEFLTYRYFVSGKTQFEKVKPALRAAYAGLALTYKAETLLTMEMLVTTGVSTVKDNAERNWGTHLKRVKEYFRGIDNLLLTKGLVHGSGAASDKLQGSLSVVGSVEGKAPASGEAQQVPDAGVSAPGSVPLDGIGDTASSRPVEGGAGCVDED